MVNARNAGTVIPAFNVTYLPMMEPVIEAIRHTRSFALIAVAQIEWEKFGAGGLKEIWTEYERLKDPRFSRLHLDHVPVVHENGTPNDYQAIIAEAIDLGYDSVMVDGSYLPLEENIAATHAIVQRATTTGIPVEAEVGAVMGYSGVSIHYDELFTSRKGFTDIDQARRFVESTGADWLSIAIGNIHGALTNAQRNQKKIAARLDIEHLRRIEQAVNLPLVLHGGSGIPKACILEAVRNGITKINVGTTIRQPYEANRSDSQAKARHAVYESACRVLTEELELTNSVDVINPTEREIKS